MTPANVQKLEKDVQRLVDRRVTELSKKFVLRVAGSMEEGGWLYVIVEPDRPGVHMEDYIDIARWVEQELEKMNPADSVLLVPAAPQD